MNNENEFSSLASQEIRDTQTKEIFDFRGFENKVFKQSEIFGTNYVGFQSFELGVQIK